MVTQNMFLCYFTHQKCGGNSIINFKPNHVSLIFKFEVFTSNTNDNHYTRIFKTINNTLTTAFKKMHI